MTALPVRLLALAAAGLLAGMLAYAVAQGSSGPGTAGTLPQPVGAPDGSWYAALAAVSPGGFPRRSTCGYRLTARTLGVAHPVLPCGVKLFVRRGNRQALTQVVDRGPAGPGRELDLTPALARLLHLRGVQRVEWAYAS